MKKQKIRVISMCVQEESDTANVTDALDDFGFYTYVLDTGCGDGGGGYYLIIVSDQPVSKALQDEILECPPSSHNWSDREDLDIA